jgi:hypothetical protein
MMKNPDQWAALWHDMLLIQKDKFGILFDICVIVGSKLYGITTLIQLID